MSNQFTKSVIGRHALRIVMHGVASVRLISLMAVIAIFSGLIISDDDGLNSSVERQEDLQSAFTAEEADSGDSESEMDMEQTKARTIGLSATAGAAGGKKVEMKRFPERLIVAPRRGL